MVKGEEKGFVGKQKKRCKERISGDPEGEEQARLEEEGDTIVRREAH